MARRGHEAKTYELGADQLAARGRKQGTEFNHNNLDDESKTFEVTGPEGLLRT